MSGGMPLSSTKLKLIVSGIAMIWWLIINIWQIISKRLDYNLVYNSPYSISEPDKLFRNYQWNSSSSITPILDGFRIPWTCFSVWIIYNINPDIVVCLRSVYLFISIQFGEAGQSLLSLWVWRDSAENCSQLTAPFGRCGVRPQAGRPTRPHSRPMISFIISVKLLTRF